MSTYWACDYHGTHGKGSFACRVCFLEDALKIIVKELARIIVKQAIAETINSAMACTHTSIKESVKKLRCQGCGEIHAGEYRLDCKGIDDMC